MPIFPLGVLHRVSLKFIVNSLNIMSHASQVNSLCFFLSKIFIHLLSLKTQLWGEHCHFWRSWQCQPLLNRKYVEKACRVANSSWFAWEFPRLSMKNPTSWKISHSWANRKGWPPSTMENIYIFIYTHYPENTQQETSGWRIKKISCVLLSIYYFNPEALSMQWKPSTISRHFLFLIIRSWA